MKIDNKVVKALRVIGQVFIVLFIALSFFDLYKYNTAYKYGSAPFYLYVLVRAVEFLIPSLICFIIARFFKKEKV
ncbi:hypothetical protein KQI42_17750 [Tissierella sp. MSJ-40]|uniref:Uncharacterized protein n=1 Tax=Tissierella simiarum TaxID=2841534 RepID=A0ABS6EAA2_9FIRM|nr:hypothetical protein [Tissierella simiarum]MBU5439863.1 hypothetical protein [Tissierella simiarum]